ncbi:fliI [Symbiodinium natans]|uniref:FliI protein n=1 Tax=Symbiodinium natans TaxID=878477 RepID=A0A812MY15_9DINO|nr:fliI [Symbiodinium natans]
MISPARSRFGWKCCRALGVRRNTAVSESTFSLLQQIQRTHGSEDQGTLQSVAGSVLRVTLPGPVFVGQGLRVREAPAVVLRFDRAGVVAALLASDASPPTAGEVVVPGRSLALQSRQWAAGVTYASVADLLTSEGSPSESLLKLPANPAVPSRRPIRQRLASGLAAAELLLPLGQGHRVGLVGPPGTGKSASLRMLVASQPADTAVVYAAVRSPERLRSEFEALGFSERSAPAVVLCAEPRASAAERYFLVLSALRLATSLRKSHQHVLLAVDDCMNFAEAANELNGAPPVPPAQAVAAMLDTGGNFEDEGAEHALSVAIALDLVPEDELPTTAREVWRGAEPSLDVCLNFSAKLAAHGVLPAIDLDVLLSSAGYPPVYQAPLLGALRKEIRKLLERSKQLNQRLETGRELGFHAETEDLDALGSDTVARALLSHSKPRSLRELAVLACASVVYYFPHHRTPPRSALAGFQAEVLESIRSECPAIWDSLDRLEELKEADVGQLLRELGEPLLARRFHYQLTRGDM